MFHTHLNRLCLLPCSAETEGSIDLERVLAIHAKVVAHVRDFTVLALLAWRTDFDGDHATLRRLCQTIRYKKRVLPDLDELIIGQVWRVSFR